MVFRTSVFSGHAAAELVAAANQVFIYTLRRMSVLYMFSPYPAHVALFAGI